MADVGYTSDDPLTDLKFGYRSNSARQPSTLFARDAEISYNGFVFPPVTNAKATIVQEYTKDNRSVKFLTIAITVESFITQYDLAAPEATATGYTIDRHMDEIRKRLSQPCQVLSFNFQGLGNIQINGVRDTTAGTAIYDVDYGPKPQVLDWQPLGGSLGARVEWLVTTRIPPCTVANNGLQGVLDFGYEVNWTLGDPGWLSRTVKGYIELAGTRQANTSTTATSNKTIDLSQSSALFDMAVERLEGLFSTLPGFLRNPITYGVSANKKALTYTIVDTQIQSPTPYPKGAIEVEMEETLESSMDGGAAFSIWNWGFSGSVKVANTGGITNIPDNKRLCFSAFALAVKDRLDRVRNSGTALTYQHETVSHATDIPRAHNVVYIPNRFRVSNQCFGTEIKIQADYTLYCPGNLIFAASGMFDHVRIPGQTWEAWRRYLDEHGIKAKVVDTIPQQDIIVDLCHPLTSDVARNVNFLPDSTTFGRIPTPDAFTIPVEEETWLDYKNSFYFLNKNFTVVGSLLSDKAHNITEGISNNPATDQELNLDMKSPKESAGDSKNKFKPDVQTGAEPIGYVTMLGSAVRLGYTINAPRLLSIGGAAAIKTGDDVTVSQTTPTGFFRQAGAGLTQATVNMHRLAWRRTYALTKPPSGWKAVTDGYPQNFI